MGFFIMQRVVPFSSKSFSFTRIIWKPLHHPVIVKEDIKQSFFSILVPWSPKGRSNDDWIWEPSLLAVSSCWNNTCVPPALRINSLWRIFWNPSFTPRRVRLISSFLARPRKTVAMPCPRGIKVGRLVSHMKDSDSHVSKIYEPGLGSASDAAISTMHVLVCHEDACSGISLARGFDAYI